MTAHFDVLPTLIDLCDLDAPQGVSFDGRSFKTQLYEPEKKLAPRTLFVELQRTLEPQKWKQAAAMTNRWRLVNNRELYDMSSDPGQTTNVAAQHPEVLVTLRKGFDAYWQHVTPGDRERPSVIVGSPSDEETFLHAADWYAQGTPWNHAQVANGPKKAGSWLIEVDRAGLYRFEVSRWPREARACIRGIPELNKTVDAWNRDQPVRVLIYGSKYTALPAHYIQLKLGDFSETTAVDIYDTCIRFDVPLYRGDREIEALMLDRDRQVIAGAYYVYITRLDNG